MKTLSILLIAVVIGGCCGSRETTTNIVESDSVVTVYKMIPFYLPAYRMELNPIIRTGVRTTYAPVKETFASKDSTVRVDIDRENPDSPTALFTFNGDSVDALGKEVTYWKERYESKETKIGDSWWENLKDYAIGGVLIIVFIGLVLIVSKVRPI